MTNIKINKKVFVEVRDLRKYFNKKNQAWRKAQNRQVVNDNFNNL